MPKLLPGLAFFSAMTLLLAGCSEPSKEAARCDDFQLVLSYVANLGGLSMTGITDDMLPELIDKTEGPLLSHFVEVRSAYMEGTEPDLSGIIEICQAAGIQLVEPEQYDWSGVDFD